MQSVELKQVVSDALEDAKGVGITWLDVTDQTDITDYMAVVSGTSSRHVKSVVARVIEFAAKAGKRPIGVEGLEDGEWVLVDLGDIIVHVMVPKAREFYDLERLWSISSARSESFPLIEH